MMKKVNTSGLHFSDLMEDGKYYVDKTLLIKDILDMDDAGYTCMSDLAALVSPPTSPCWTRSST